MIASVDLRATRPQSSDHLGLRAYLQQLVGQPFLSFRFSYGDELTLHFGEPRKYTTPTLTHLTKGSYIIGARASSWFLTTRSPPTVIIGTAQPVSSRTNHIRPLTKEQVETSELVESGTRIVAVDAVTLGTAKRSAYGFGLSLLLADGSSILLLPPPMLKRILRSQQIADWEIFTPYDRYLSVGPGLRWCYLASRTAKKASG
jgi:hypothetical protein